MPRTALIGLFFAAAGIGVLIALLGLWRGGWIGPVQTISIEPRPAIAQLQTFQCRTSERKVLLLRGVEDAYAPNNDEPAELSDQASSIQSLSMATENTFDVSQADNIFQDHTRVPSRLSDGLIVIRMRPVVESANDNLQLGDRSRLVSYRQSSGHFSRYIRDLEAAGWSRSGDVYSARISEVTFDAIQLVAGEGLITVPTRAEHRTLLEYIRAGDGETVVDLQVQDDTSVDFWGIAACVEPEGGQGVTYLVRPAGGYANVAGLVHLVGDSTSQHYRANPYTGDTPCETELPVACFLDLDLPLPRQLNDEAPGTFVRRYWSGGIIAATPPVAGSRFRTIMQADAHCATEFGEGWRVLTYHDGGQPRAALAYGGLSDLDQRYWIDIRGQPYGTCWAHE